MANPTSSSTQTAYPGGTMGAEADTLPDMGMSASDVPRITDVAEPLAAAAAAREDMMDRVVQGAHNAIDRLAETLAPHVRSMNDGVGRYGESMQERADHWREVGDEWTESLRHTVRERPIAAVGVALAVGLLVARITR